MSQSLPSASPFAGKSWTCTGCGAKLPIRAEHAGRKCRCDRCGLEFLVPATQGSTTGGKCKPISGGKQPPNTPDDLWNMDELWGVEEAPHPSQLIEQQPELFPILCGLCQTLMYATEGQLGSKLVCPDCGRKTFIYFRLLGRLAWWLSERQAGR